MGLYTILCAISAVLQGISAFLTIKGEHKVWQKTKEGNMTDKPSIPLVVWLLIIGACLSAFIGVWMGYHPPQPKIVTVTREVEKPITCPITEQKTGPSTARGGRDVNAHSGNGDNFNAAPPQAPPANPKN
ncbi:hypothetical protein [Tunturiibacter psychrotolerans]|uniref:hypothetical protein n=1 Tax=Tunturiibacter psychrotolerans TaxID=3069686 RepID=UPI003D240C07